jgi:hypothetical protein
MDWTIRDSNPGRSHGVISSPKRQDGICGPPRLLFNRYRGLLLSGVKRPEREADHSFPSTAEAKKEFLELYLYSAYMPSWCEHGKYFFYQKR